MIHDQLFAVQSSEQAHTPHVTPLTELTLRRSLSNFKNSAVRNRVWACVEQSDFSGDFSEASGLEARVINIVLGAVSNSRETGQ